MEASVFQGRMLTKPTQSMVDPTDVEMAKEEHGRMMSTGLQVLRPPCYCFSDVWFIRNKVLTVT